MMSWKNLLTFIILLTPAWAGGNSPLVPSYAPQFKSEQWDKVLLQDWLAAKITEQGEKIVPRDQFMVSISIQMMTTPARVESRRSRSLNIEKFGINVNLPGGKVFVSPGLPKDFFKRIDFIDVNFAVSSDIDKQKLATIRELPFRTIQFLPASQVRVTVDSVGGWTNPIWRNFFKDFQVGLVMLLVASFLGLLFWLAVRSLKQLGTGINQTMTEVGVKLIQAVKEKPEYSGLGVAPSQPYTENEFDTEEILEKCEGIQMFLSIAAQNPERAAYYVQQWMRMRLKGAKQALLVIPQFLPQSVFLSVMKQLDLSSRRKWNRIMTVRLKQESIAMADSFLGGQLEPEQSSDSFDEHLAGLLKSLSSEEILRFVERNADLGSVLINFLPAKRVAHTISLMDHALVDKLLKGCMHPERQVLVPYASEIKSLIQSVREQSKEEGLLHGVERVVPHAHAAGLEGEKLILESAMASGDWQRIREAAIKSFPTHLVWNLSVPILKEALLAFTLDELVQLLAGVPAAHQKCLIEATHQLGDKVSGYVLVEAQNCRDSINKRTEAEQEYHQLFVRLADSIRTMISIDSQARQAAHSVIDEWIQTQTRKSHNAA